MKVFIWERIKECTNNYHPEGGVVVIANTLKDAILLAKKEGAIINVDEVPDFSQDLSEDYKEVAFIMPDSGCC